MSRTNKTMPERVVTRKFGREYHNHIDGVCTLDQFSNDPGTRLSSSHFVRCAKRYIVTYECQHDEYGYSTTRFIMHNGERLPVRYCDHDGEMFSGVSHESWRRVEDASIPCSCDNMEFSFPRSSCGYETPRSYEHPAGISGYGCSCCDNTKPSVVRSSVRQRLSSLRGRIDDEAIDDFDLGM